jgi:diguanylate cyclase (GGDEF)-like protein
MNQIFELFKTEMPKPKLLIVDDQPLVIRVLYELFKIDCEVFMSTSGEDALQKCQEIKPDLVLLDIVMPDMDGYEVCKRLKANEDLSDIPVIFVTSSADDADEAKCFDVGAVDFIQKPVNAVITRSRVNTHLRLKRQSDLFKSMALFDGLTGIANRRHFESSIHLDWLQCAREQTPISLLLMDIDHFKQFNDCYGHQAGDQCLQKVAKSLSTVLGRPYDLVARYGGEEFAIILPKTNHEGAIYVAQNIISAVKNLGIPHIKSNTGLITLSTGVATTIPHYKTSPDTLISEADKALYKAKENGRNQIMSVEFNCIR